MPRIVLGLPVVPQNNRLFLFDRFLSGAILESVDKERRDVKATADDMTRQIAEKFAKLFSEKVNEIKDELHEHLDEHMDEIEEMLVDGLSSLHNHLGALERLEKLEKKMQQMETVEKRFVT